MSAKLKELAKAKKSSPFQFVDYCAVIAFGMSINWNGRYLLHSALPWLSVLAACLGDVAKILALFPASLILGLYWHLRRKPCNK